MVRMTKKRFTFLLQHYDRTDQWQDEMMAEVIKMKLEEDTKVPVFRCK